MPEFVHPYRVTYADCTIGDHVYYGRFLSILEISRNEFFRNLGVTFLEWQRRGYTFPVVECRLQYKAQAHYDDLLTIQLRAAAMERVRLTLAYKIITQNGTLVLEAETVHACANLAGRPKRLPEELKSALSRHLLLANQQTSAPAIRE